MTSTFKHDFDKRSALGEKIDKLIHGKYEILIDRTVSDTHSKEHRLYEFRSIGRGEGMRIYI